MEKLGAQKGKRTERERMRRRMLKMKKIEEIRRRREGGEERFEYVFFWFLSTGRILVKTRFHIYQLGLAAGVGWMVISICDPFTALGMICMYSEIRCHCHHFTC